MKMWPGRGGQMGGPRWPNGRKGDRRLLWPSVWKIFFRSGQILQFTHDLFQFYQAFATKNFVGWENDSQSWNPCFLGVVVCWIVYYAWYINNVFMGWSWIERHQDHSILLPPSLLSCSTMVNIKMGTQENNNSNTHKKHHRKIIFR